MIVVSTRVPVAEAQDGAYAERLYDRVGLLERHRGFLRLEVLRPSPVLLSGQPLGHSESYVVLTYWASKEDFAAWAMTRDFQRAHARRTADDHFAGTIAFEVHEVIQSTESAQSRHG
jgi:heme-degrading monooxygenase HmoA